MDRPYIIMMLNLKSDRAYLVREIGWETVRRYATREEALADIRDSLQSDPRLAAEYRYYVLKLSEDDVAK